VLNGGFPVNFDREREWERFEEIMLTRKLILEGLFQAKGLSGTSPRAVMMNPAVQLRIVEEWLNQVPDRSKIRIPSPLTEKFFQMHSEGEHVFSQRPVYTLHSTTPANLAKMRTHKRPYEITLLRLPILVLPGVWSPAYDWSSQFHVENLPEMSGLVVLEIGCGTGVISVFVANAGAKRVVATDINETAVENARRNFERFGVQNGEVLLSDLFANVQGKYDVIIWNAPYHGAKPMDVLERGCADQEYHDIRAFFASVSAYLNPGGVIVFGFSESGDLPLIESLIKEHGFTSRRKLSDWRRDYNCMIFELVPSNARYRRDILNNDSEIGPSSPSTPAAR
jgi:2-polyprenyl-3-methyl-5-hydroxy-6-metoxy-1,4-benzoquinol methylase